MTTPGHFTSQLCYNDNPLNAPDGSASQNSHATHSTYSYNSLLRSHQTQYFLSDLDKIDIDSTSYHPSSCSFPITHPQMEWQQTPDFCYSVGEPYYEFPSSSLGGHDGDWVLGGQSDISSCPRSWQPPYDTRDVRSFDIAGGDVIKYLPHEDNSCEQDMEYSPNENTRRFKRLSISRSPPRGDAHLVFDSNDFEFPMDQANIMSCKSSDNGEDDHGDSNLSNPDDRMPEEPYAKLIYRALMGAPNHSMVLQEIYQWFIEHTDKGSSTSSGWRNSIRHNLSMNAAFRKTDRKLSGEETKKTSEWVLEPFAIKSGVTPTTRYRKTTKKAVKTDTPSSSRARAGRRGGEATGKSKLRHKPKEDHQEGFTILSNDSRQKYSPRRYRLTSSADTRQFSPSTPATHDTSTSSPYFSKPASPYDGLPDDGLNFTNVSGLYLDDGPVFCTDDGSPFGELPVHTWSNYQY